MAQAVRKFFPRGRSPGTSIATEPTNISTIPAIILEGTASCRIAAASIVASTGLKKNTRDAVFADVRSIAVK